MRPRLADPRRGAALFFVLAMAALLTTLAAATMRTGISGARAAAVFADEARADELGRGAGDVVAYRLMTGEAEDRRGGRLSVRLGDAVMAIDYLSESSRIDVNTAPVPLISALLSAAGADAALVSQVADRITQSRPITESAQPDGSPDHPDPLPPNAVPPSASGASGPPAIQTPLDVVRAWGLPEEVGRRALPALTVANGSKQVDPILADRLVVLALFDGDDKRADDFIERRAQGFVNTDSALLLLPAPAKAFVGFHDVPAVRAVARVSIARRFERRYEVIVAPGQGASPRPTVVSWRKLL